MVKRIGILGSTGSIGTSALQVIAHLGEEYQVVALAARSNVAILISQIRAFQPELVALHDECASQEIRNLFPHLTVLSGMEGLKAVASYCEADLIISAMTGTVGLAPTLAAIEAGKDVALANKEVLISGGDLITRRVREKNVRLLPIDSEHSALYQCLQGNEQKSVQRLILTASGGPFYTWPDEKLKRVAVEDALAHPNWRMGPKITIDCSTLMNKGLEVIEAHWLFGIPLKQIEVVIHPQSIIHSFVEYVDGSMLAQMGEPSMLVPIQYAITYPQRKPGLMKPFDFIQRSKLEFYMPDKKRFRCLDLAYIAQTTGKSLPAYMNAVNEILVNEFMAKKIQWHEIPSKLETLMEQHQVQDVSSLEAILEIDQQARLEAASR